MSDTLDVQNFCFQWAKKIVNTLNSRGVVCAPRKVVRSPRVMTLSVAMNDTAQIRGIFKFEEELALALSAETVRISRRGGLINFEVGLPSQYHGILSLRDIGTGNSVTVPVGIDTNDNISSLSLDNPTTPHVLVAGATGSGKSILLQVVVLGLVKQNTPESLSMILVDGKARGLMRFASVPHLVTPIITDMNKAKDVLRWSVDEMDRRKSNPVLTKRRLVIVIDEIAELLEATGGVNGVVAQYMRQLTAMGRELNINIIAATQHPTAATLGGAMAKVNMPARFCGKVADPGASFVATGQEGIRAHRLTGNGDFAFVSGDNNTRLQVALPDMDDFRLLPKINVKFLNEGISGAEEYVKLEFSPKQIAFVLSLEGAKSRRGGVNYIARALRIGNPKAAALKAFVADLNAALREQGVGIVGDKQLEVHKKSEPQVIEGTSLAS